MVHLPVVSGGDEAVPEQSNATHLVSPRASSSRGGVAKGTHNEEIRPGALIRRICIGEEQG